MSLSDRKTHLFEYEKADVEIDEFTFTYNSKNKTITFLYDI